MSDGTLNDYLEGLRHICGLEDVERITLSSRDVGGDTPLHIAIYQRNVEAARLLIEAGADIDALGEDDMTPLHCALNAGFGSLVDELIAKGANVKLKNLDGETAEQLIRRITE